MKVGEILKTLAEHNYYLLLIYDGEYNHYVVEILDPYGEIQSAGLDATLEDAINEALEENLNRMELDEE